MANVPVCFERRSAGFKARQRLEDFQHGIPHHFTLEWRLIVPDAVDLVAHQHSLGRVLQQNAARPVDKSIGNQLPRRQKARCFPRRQQIDIVIRVARRPQGFELHVRSVRSILLRLLQPHEDQFRLKPFPQVAPREHLLADTDFAISLADVERQRRGIGNDEQRKRQPEPRDEPHQKIGGKERKRDDRCSRTSSSGAGSASPD